MTSPTHRPDDGSLKSSYLTLMITSLDQEIDAGNHASFAERLETERDTCLEEPARCLGGGRVVGSTPLAGINLTAVCMERPNTSLPPSAHFRESIHASDIRCY